MDNSRGQTPQNEKPSSTHQETVAQGSETAAISPRQQMSLQQLTQRQEQMAPAHGGQFAPLAMGQPRTGGGGAREVMRSAVGGVVGGHAAAAAASAAAAAAQSPRGGSGGAASSLFLESGSHKRESEGVPDAAIDRKKTRVEGR